MLAIANRSAKSSEVFQGSSVRITGFGVQYEHRHDSMLSGNLKVSVGKGNTWWSLQEVLQPFA